MFWYWFIFLSGDNDYGPMVNGYSAVETVIEFKKAAKKLVDGDWVNKRKLGILYVERIDSNEVKVKLTWDSPLKFETIYRAWSAGGGRFTIILRSKKRAVWRWVDSSYSAEWVGRFLYIKRL